MAEEKDDFWEKGGFIQLISKEEFEKKKGTFHKSHDEDMNFKCKKCGKRISAHNKDWHNSLCDECFNNES